MPLSVHLIMMICIIATTVYVLNMHVAPAECLQLVLAFTKCFTSQRSQLRSSGYYYIILTVIGGFIPVVTLTKYVQFVHQEKLSKLYYQTLIDYVMIYLSSLPL